MLKFFKKVKKNRKGYTLTELIVVVAILGVLAAIATPMIMNQVSKARVNADDANATSIESAYKIGMTIDDPTPTIPTTGTGALAIINKSLSPIPTPKQNGFAFFLNTVNGRVSCLISSTAVSNSFLNLTSPT
jgi:type IV pilus assembly protein PilA